MTLIHLKLRVLVMTLFVVSLYAYGEEPVACTFVFSPTISSPLGNYVVSIDNPKNCAGRWDVPSTLNVYKKDRGSNSYNLMRNHAVPFRVGQAYLSDDGLFLALSDQKLYIFDLETPNFENVLQTSYSRSKAFEKLIEGYDNQLESMAWIYRVNFDKTEIRMYDVVGCAMVIDLKGKSLRYPKYYEYPSQPYWKSRCELSL